MVQPKIKVEILSGKVYKKKVNLLGAPGVGKTSLILRFVKNVYGEEYLKTIGTNIYTKTVPFKEGEVKLVLHDIMGEKAYESVRATAFRGSTGAIAVADVTRKDTLDALMNDWIPEYKEQSSESNPLILAINKFDLDEKKIGLEEIERVSSEFERTVFTSAKSGRNVEYIFKELASAVAYNLQVSIEDIDDVIAKREMETPRDLLDVIFAACSELGDLSYDEREELLRESNIEKFDLDEELFEIKEDKVLTFSQKVKEWYQKKDKDYSKSVIEKAIEKYKEDS